MIRLLADGGYAISDDIEIPGEGTTNFVFGRGWLLEILELASGEYCFITDEGVVRARGSRFGMFYPPFSLVRASVKSLRGKVAGVGSETADPTLPMLPVLFETDFDGEFLSADTAVRVLERATDVRSIAVNQAPSLVSIKAKRMIDENFFVYPSIARVAARLGVSHAHLSRQFKKDFGLSPSNYLHELRGAEASFRLSLGQEIIDISADVGYNDLSRFYKQFRKQYGMSPGRCRSSRLGND